MPILPPTIAYQLVIAVHEARRAEASGVRDASGAHRAADRPGRIQLAVAAFRQADQIGRPCPVDGRTGRLDLTIVDGAVIVACRTA